jgi:3-methylcrotonyl-CoA carboxylase alpha subunit
LFESLLIANRGEIACRIIRTARKMGVRTVAVYSEADANCLHTRQADRAIPIGPSPARDSYLCGEKILAAAKSAGVDAIHPGYGFLSENADFAESCEAAGIHFVGPSASAIRAMGSKDEAKRRMEAVGVPVVPGEHGKDNDDTSWAKVADRIGYPVLVKAVAGGGGKGMRRVDTPNDLEAALEGASREAEAAFGDPRILIEKWLTSSRHIEVQIFADGHGNVVHLFERDCSLQRRHQKVVEEAPAPGLSESMRTRMGEAAIRAAQAIDYRGAGTVEFIVDISEGIESSRFYFMEMNTRLQVEHAVTEAITGIDLVEWQLLVAAGQALPLRQDQITASGHAIEVRLYAEDPSRRYLPQTGRLVRHRPPEDDPQTRVDNGVAEGDAVSFHYDPMISKLIVHGRSRDGAIRRLRSALEEYEIAGLITNLGLLHAIAKFPAFAAGRLNTAFLAEHDLVLTMDLGHAPPELVALGCAALLGNRARTAYPQPGEDPYSPWARTDSFRLNEDGLERLLLRMGKNDLEVLVHETAQATTLEWENHAVVLRDVSIDEDRVSATLSGETHSATFVFDGDHLHVIANARSAKLEIVQATLEIGGESSGDGSIRSPMPGKIVAVLVAQGDRVERGQALLQLEAMKMEHTLKAPDSGKVKVLLAKLGQQVDEGRELIVID